MKKIILAICDKTIPEKPGSAGENSFQNVVNLIIIDTEIEKDDRDLPFIPLKADSYNELSPEILNDLLSPDNQKYLLVPESNGKMTNLEIIRNNENLLRKSVVPSAFSLTRKERVIMELLSDGLVCKEVAEKLGRSYHTIKHHVENIEGKMGVKKMGEAIERYMDYKKMVS
ncbi:MAG: helix-turn-helix transcriptional regulator [Bacteroidales bacterium]|nr:helix-turn-helix transcriptional regulator [Bacteroidales bacterium]